MSQGQMMTPVERRAFKQTGIVAAGTAAVNTAILAFTADPIASNPVTPVLPVVGGTPAAARLAQSWVLVNTVAAAANEGTNWKFVEKGFYSFDVAVPKTSADTNLTHVGISLDCPAASLLAAATINNPVIIEDFDILLQVAATQMTHHLHTIIRITDLLASTTGLAANGTPVGSVRVHANNGAGAIPASTAFVDANVTVWCQKINEIFG